MPIYLYECPECGRQDEYLVKMGEVPRECCREDCDFSGDLTKVFEGSCFAAHTNAASVRSSAQAVKKFPNEFVLESPMGIEQPHIIFVHDDNGKVVQAYGRKLEE